MWRKGEYVISRDRSILDFDLILKFLSEEAYWAQGRSAESIRRAIDNSTLCFGLYHETDYGLNQIGFARVVTDLTTFAYLADVFVLREYRGRGLGKWLIQTIVDHPDLRALKRLTLFTRTPEFYEGFDFAFLDPAEPSKFMVRSPHG